MHETGANTNAQTADQLHGQIEHAMDASRLIVN